MSTNLPTRPAAAETPPAAGLVQLRLYEQASRDDIRTKLNRARDVDSRNHGGALRALSTEQSRLFRLELYQRSNVGILRIENCTFLGV